MDTNQTFELQYEPLSSLTQPSRHHRRAWRMMARVVCTAVVVFAVIENLALRMQPHAALAYTAGPPSAIATLTPHQQAGIYEGAVEPRAKTLMTELPTLSADCRVNISLACVQGFQQLQTDAAGFHRFLGPLPVPACLQTANTHFNAGFAYFQNGATLGFEDTRSNSFAEIQLAVRILARGNADFSLAFSELGHVRC